MPCSRWLRNLLPSHIFIVFVLFCCFSKHKPATNPASPCPRHTSDLPPRPPSDQVTCCEALALCLMAGSLVLAPVSRLNCTDVCVGRETLNSLDCNIMRFCVGTICWGKKMSGKWRPAVSIFPQLLWISSSSSSYFLFPVFSMCNVNLICTTGCSHRSHKYHLYSN